MYSAALTQTTHVLHVHMCLWLSILFEALLLSEVFTCVLIWIHVNICLWWTTTQTHERLQISLQTVNPLCVHADAYSFPEIHQCVLHTDMLHLSFNFMLLLTFTFSALQKKKKKFVLAMQISLSPAYSTVAQPLMLWLGNIFKILCGFLPLPP